jgi:hypothetical protein
MMMAVSFIIETVKGVLLKPRETFEQITNSSLTETYQQYVLLLIIYSVLMGLVSAAFVLLNFIDILVNLGSIHLLGPLFVSKITLVRPILMNWSMIVVYLLFLFLLFGIFIKGCFLHVFVILFGGKQGVIKTIQVLMYAATPFFLLGWIPYLSIIGLIWAIVLCMIGLQTVQQVPVWKAVSIIVVPVILLSIGVFLLLLMRAALMALLSGLLVW